MILDRFAKWFAKWYHYQVEKRGILFVYCVYSMTAMIIIEVVDRLLGKKLSFITTILYACIWIILIAYAEKKAEVIS
jgi:hypothetical protein